MRCIVRVKTGFFKTALYWLNVEPGCLRLVPFADGEEPEQLYNEEALFAILLLAGKTASIEIHGRERLISAALSDSSQLPELLRALRQNVNTHITCEFIGDGTS